MRRFLSNLLRDFRKTSTARGVRRAPRRANLQLEALEDRTVPTVVFTSALGGDTIFWVPGNSAGKPDNQVQTGPISNNPSVLNSTTVYLDFWGDSWTKTNAAPLANAAQSIIQSKYLSQLSDYGFHGTVSFGGYTIDNTHTSDGNSSGDPQDGQNVTTEITNLLNGNLATDPSLPTSSWLRPPDLRAQDSPIYIVVYDNGFTGANTPALYLSGHFPNFNLAMMNQIYVGAAGGQDDFTDTFSHEMAERISDGDDNGIRMNATTNAGTDNEFQNAQISDNEPDDHNYTYRINGPNGQRVQAYWSLTYNGFVVPDGNSQTVYCDPIWNNGTTPGSPPSFTHQSNLVINGGQLFFLNNGIITVRNDILTLGETPAGGVSVKLNGEVFQFDISQLGLSQINNITINTSHASSTVNVLATQFGVLTSIYDYGNDTMVLGNTDGQVAGGAGHVGNIHGSVYVSPFGDLTTPGRTSLHVDDSGDSTGQAVTVKNGEIDYAGALSIYYNVASTAAGGVVSVEVDGGSGGDTFAIASAALGIPVCVHSAASNGSLTVNDQSASAAESYTITPTWTSRPGWASLSYFNMGRVTINGGNHGNSFSVPSTSTLTSVTVNAGSGNDTITVGNNTDGLGDLNFESAVTVNGVAGHTTLILNDQAGVRGGLLVENTDVSQGFTQIDYANISNLIVDAQSAGSYEVDVVRTPVGTRTTVNAGAGGDMVHLGGTLTGIVNSVLGPVTINGAGNTQSIAYDQTDATAQTYTVTPTTFVDSGFSLSYSNLGSLTINGGSANDVYDILSTAAGTPVILNAGSGTNTFNVGIGNSLSGIHGALTVNGGGGTDTLNANDSNSASGQGNTLAGGQSYTLSSTQLAGSDFAAITYAALSAINVTGSGNDTLTLLRPVPTVATRFDGGSGANTLQGPNVDSTWTISGANSGKLYGVSFRDFQNLVGGSSVDVFDFISASATVLSINGGGAEAHDGDWLDYWWLPSTSTVTVNLATGSATNVNNGAAGAVTNIQNVFGSASGTNILTGDAQGNILVGGSGANTLIGGSGASLLIGGSGHGTITGGSGSDILIAGTVAANDWQLMAILAELQSADTFAQKVSDIMNGNKLGGGSDLNGSSKLTWGGTSPTVTASPGTFTLSGATAATDWFFSNAFSTVTDFGGQDEHNNNAMGVF